MLALGTRILLLHMVAPLHHISGQRTQAAIANLDKGGILLDSVYQILLIAY